jgi:RES domain-containing protein
VSSATARQFEGAVWRVHWREVPATDWSLSLRTSGRYHRGFDLFSESQAFPALYTSLAAEVAIWEMVRRSAARNLAFLRNNVLSELHVELARVLDLSTPEAVGLTIADLTGPDLDHCQELASAALSDGIEALLVPSAAMPGSNLVLLPANLPEPTPIRVVRSVALPLERLASGDDESADA